MNDSEFYNSFSFNEFTYNSPETNNNLTGILIHYLGYIKKGNGVLVSKKERIELKEGDMFYIPKGCKYISHWKTGKDYTVFDSFGFKYFPNKTSSTYKLQKIAYSRELFKEYQYLSNNKAVNIYSIGLLYLIMGKLTESMETEPLEYHQQIIEKAKNLIRENTQYKMSDIALACDISEATLYNIFKDKLKKTPNTVRQEIMCQKAADLLSTTNIKIEDISAQTGFSSSSYFRKIFREYMNKTPKEYRKESKLIV